MEKKPRTVALGKILSAAIILVLLFALGILVYLIVNPQPKEKFTEFYILGVSGQASDYPKKLQVGEEAQVIIGIINRELEVVSYQVEVKVEGVAGSILGPIVLEPAGKFEQIASFTADRPGEKQKVEFILFKEEAQYSQLYLQVDVFD